METTPSNPEQESALPLECQIEAQPEYALGKPITVKGLLRNSGAASLWILRRNTFLQPHCGDCLLVTRNGSSVPYIGISVFHGAPSAESYLRIPAGESVEAQIDLSENYAIREAGDYEISCRLPVLGTVDEGDAKPPESSAQLKLALIESKKATFRIAGSGSTLLMTRPEIANLSSSPEILNLSSQVNYPSEPMKPTYYGMSDQEQSDYFWAHRTAYQKIVASLKQPDPLYGQWFGDIKRYNIPLRPGWEGRRKTVMENLANMAEWMKSTSTDFIKDSKCNVQCKQDYIGSWTGCGTKGSIHLCPAVFDHDFLSTIGGWSKGDDWTRAFIVIHEVSHAAAGTKDLFYPWEECQKVASLNPDTAVTNAQNYALFGMETDTSQIRYEPVVKVDLKDGDQICLKADNGVYLTIKGNFLFAQATSNICKFTVIVDDRYPSSIMLQTAEMRTNQKGYLYLPPDGTNQIETSLNVQEDWCRFKVGEFEDHKNEKFLVLRARNGNLLCRNNENAICADRHDVDPTCLFQLIKV